MKFGLWTSPQTDPSCNLSKPRVLHATNSFYDNNNNDDDNDNKKDNKNNDNNDNYDFVDYNNDNNNNNNLHESQGRPLLSKALNKIWFYRRLL